MLSLALPVLGFWKLNYLTVKSTRMTGLENKISHFRTPNKRTDLPDHKGPARNWIPGSFHSPPWMKHFHSQWVMSSTGPSPPLPLAVFFFQMNLMNCHSYFSIHQFELLWYRKGCMEKLNISVAVVIFKTIFSYKLREVREFKVVELRIRIAF